MSIAKMSPGRRRAIAISILCVVTVAALGVTVVPIWLVNRNLGSRIEELGDLLVRYENIVEQDSEIREYYTRLTEARSSSGQLLKSESASVAAAEIQRALRSITDGNDAALLSTQILPATDLDEEGLQPVGVRVRIRGTLPSVVKSIYDLESNSMLLFLENFSLRIAGDRRVGNSPLTRSFEANFDVIGLMSVLQ
jgi:hypothetical protein